jgi:hypothetical protein
MRIYTVYTKTHNIHEDPHTTESYCVMITQTAMGNVSLHLRSL